MIYFKRLLVLILMLIVNIFGFLLLLFTIIFTPIYYFFDYIINGRDAQFDKFANLVLLLLTKISNFINKIEPK